MTFAKFGVFWAVLALPVNIVCAEAQGGGEFPRYCLTIAVELRPTLRERVSVIDLVIENASVVSIPRFPPGWELKIQNQIDSSPTLIFGGATGSVAELAAEDMSCLFQIENSVPGRPPINVNGKVTISTGTTESEIVLGKRHILLQPTARGGP